jgi:hypothetical protein
VPRRSVRNALKTNQEKGNEYTHLIILMQ